jgi:hypothetical protein
VKTGALDRQRGRWRAQPERWGRPWQSARLRRQLRPGPLHGGRGRPSQVAARIMSSAVCWRPSPSPFRLRPFQDLCYPEPYAVQKCSPSAQPRPIMSVLVSPARQSQARPSAPPTLHSRLVQNSPISRDSPCSSTCSPFSPPLTPLSSGVLSRPAAALTMALPGKQ